MSTRRFVRCGGAAGLFFWVAIILPIQGQEADPARAKQIAELEKQIAEIQGKLNALKAPASPKEKKPLTIAESNTWRSIRGSTLSNDGNWYACRIGSLSGPSEVILRSVKTDKEQKFAGGSGSGEIGFSYDSKWFAFSEGAGGGGPGGRGPGGGGPMGTGPRRSSGAKIILVRLADGAKTELESVRDFEFSGEASTHIVFRKVPAESSTSTAPAGPPGLPGATGPRATGESGNDLIVRDLTTGAELTLGNVSNYGFNKKGTLLALLIDSAGQIGNGVQLRDMKTGVIYPIETGKASYQSLRWTPSGDALSVMKGVEEKGVEGKVHSIIGFTEPGPNPKRVEVNPKNDPNFPKGMGISANRSPYWMEDLSGIVFGIAEQKRTEEPKTEPKKEPAKEPAKEPKKDGPTTAPRTGGGGRPDVVIWHWKDSRLQSAQQVQAPFDRNFTYSMIFRTAEKKFVRLADDALRNVTLSPRFRFAVGIDRRPYELSGTLNGQSYGDVYSVNPGTGEKKKILTKVRFAFGTSDDGTRFLYYQDGHFYLADMANGKATNITSKTPTSFVDGDDDHNVDKPPTRPIGFSSDGKFVLLSDGRDIWQVAVTGETSINLTQNGKSKGIEHFSPSTFDPEERGINLAKPLYVRMTEERTKKSGYGRIEPGKPGVAPLVWEDAEIASLQRARHADVFAYTRETCRDYPDVYLTADPALKAAKKVTTANPQQADFLWTAGSRLVDYTSVSGQKLQGALYLPSNYEKGKKYPTVVYIYEKLSDELHKYQGPSTGGFNRAIYTSNGYAVLMPDIKYRLNDPGKSSVECILPALDAAIATGVVDADKVAIHGHSWGGYQTAFMITQTDRFKAAIAGAPLTNLISMYSSIYWNSGSANQPIFESSQGRFTAGYFDLQEAYIRNSPVFHAKNVKTPLLLLHNDKDGAVDWTQGIEYFNTLRRLEKPVVMLQYRGENHGLRNTDNRRDYAVRMKEFLDHYLMGKPAPDWWKDGVPHLKIDEHLKGRKN